jgi:hypothetical protein
LKISVPGFVKNPIGTLVGLNVFGNVVATLKELKSVAGANRVLERVGAYGAPTVLALAQIMERHFDGASTAGMNRALGVTKGAVGPLAVVAAPYLESSAHAYVQFAVGAGAIFGVASKSDWPAYISSATLFFMANCYFAGSIFGVTDVVIRNAQAFFYANAILLFITTARARALLNSKQIASLRKMANTVPMLMMGGLMMQGASFAKMSAAGMSGPGILGPVTQVLFQPLSALVNTCSCLAYLSGFSSKRASFIIFVELLIVTISLAPQFVYPYGQAMQAIHLGMTLAMMRDCFPANSLIPKLK